MIFTNNDRKFLRELKIAADPEPAPAPSEIDDTCRLLMEMGLPVTAEAWMNLQFAGSPPKIGEVDGEVLAELPRFVRVVYDPAYNDNRIPYGSENRWGADAPCPEFCPECGTDFGMLHQAGCDVEEGIPEDGTCHILRELGLPLTRENYLRLEFAGNPSEEPRRYSDFTFLRACGVNPVFSLAEFRAANKHHAVEPCRDCGARTLQQHAKTCRHRVALDGTVQLMAKHGIPITRENYLRLEFMGNPPEEPLDGELDAELPEQFQEED